MLPRSGSAHSLMHRSFRSSIRVHSLACRYFTSTTHNLSHSHSHSHSHTHHSSVSASTSTSTPSPFKSLVFPPSLNASLPPLYLLRMDSLRLTLHDQLLIEEVLLRNPQLSEHNFCVFNIPPRRKQASELLPYHSPTTNESTQHLSIVMGISNKTNELLEFSNCQKDDLFIIRRFSGGGTVLCDDRTVMVSLMVNKQKEEETTNTQAKNEMKFPSNVWNATQQLVTDASSSSPSSSSSSTFKCISHPSHVPCFPRNIMDWTRDFYSPVFNPIQPHDYANYFSSTNQSSSSNTISPISIQPFDPNMKFDMVGNDYVFGDRKFGGNAQTITKNRWLHHTSFLWDFTPELFSQYLAHPKKIPDYRKERRHEEFVTKLKDVYSQVKEWEEQYRLLLKMTAEDEHAYSMLNRCPYGVPSSSLITQYDLFDRIRWRLSHFFDVQEISGDALRSLIENELREKVLEYQPKSSVKILKYADEILLHEKKA